MHKNDIKAIYNRNNFPQDLRIAIKGILTLHFELFDCAIIKAVTFLSWEKWDFFCDTSRCLKATKLYD